MGRYQIALGKVPEEIIVEKLKIDNIPKGIEISYFTDIKVMLEYMTEKGGVWVPQSDLYFEDVPLVGYKSTDEITLIRAIDLHSTEYRLTESERKIISEEKVLRFRNEL